MPKIVDHTVRRADLARAALRLCAREGLDAVTIGQVAAEAGVSKGLVQHYFPTKEALLRLAARTLRDDVARTVGAAVDGAGAPADVLRRVLFALVGLGREQVLAGHAFFARAAADPVVRDLYRDGASAAVEGVGALVAAAGGAPSDARVLLALARALADDVLVGELDPANAESIMDNELDRVLTVRR